MSLRKISVLLVSFMLLCLLAQNTFAGKVGDYVRKTGDCFKRQATGWRLFGWVAATILTGGYALVALGVHCTVGTHIIEKIGKEAFEAFINMISDGLGRLVEGLVELFRMGLTYEPIWDNYDSLLRVMYQLILPFIFIQLIVTAAYLLFGSIDPGQRNKGKHMLTKALTAALFVPVSKQIFILLYDIMNGVTNEIFSVTFSMLTTAVAGGMTPAGFIAMVFTGIVIWAIVQALADGGSALSILGWIAAFMTAVVILVFVRWAMIILFYCIFPFTLFLYLFEYTRSLGGNLLMKTLMWIAMGPVMALILCITIVSLMNMLDPMGAGSNVVQKLQQNPKSAVITMNVVTIAAPPGNAVGIGQALLTFFISLFMFFGGVLMLLAVPLVMTALMKWIGGAVAAGGMKGLATNTDKVQRWNSFSQVVVGGVMMGQGGAAMTHAAAGAAWMGRDSQGNMGSMMPSFSEIKNHFSPAARRARANSPGGGGGGLLSNIGGVFASPGAEASKYWADRQAGGKWGRPQAGGGGGLVGDSLHTSESSAKSAIGGDVGLVRDAEHDRPGDDTTTMSRAQRLQTHQNPGELVNTKDGSVMAEDQDRYNIRGMTGEYSTKETYAAIMPSMEMSKRVDTAFDGARATIGGVMGLVAGKGSSIGHLKNVGTGVGKLILSAAPLSPFMPIRMLGRTLVSLSPLLIPPAFSPFAMWAGQRMMGLGFRQMIGRSRDNVQMGYLTGRYRDLSEECEHLEAKQSAGTITSSESARLAAHQEEMASIVTRTGAALDRMGKTSAMAGVMAEGVDVQNHQKHLNKIFEDPRNADLAEALHKHRRVTDLSQDRLTQPIRDMWKTFMQGDKLPDGRTSRELSPAQMQEMISITRNMVAHDPGMKTDVDSRIAALDTQVKDPAFSSLPANEQTRITRELNTLREVRSDLDQIEKWNSADTDSKKIVDDLRKLGGEERKNRMDSLRALIGSRQEMFFSVGFLRQNNIGKGHGASAIQKQRQFLDANQGFFAWHGKGKDRKLLRREHLALPGAMGGAAKSMEKVFQSDYKSHLMSQGVSFEEAEKRSAAINLRLYEGKDGTVYMTAHDLPYLNQMMERKDWASDMARMNLLGSTIFPERTARVTTYKDEDYDEQGMVINGREGQFSTVTIKGGVEVTLRKRQVEGVELITDPDGNPVVTVGTKPRLHDGDRVNLLKVEETHDAKKIQFYQYERDAKGKLVLDANGNRKLEAVDNAEAREMLRSGAVTHEHFMIADPLANKGSAGRIEYKRIDSFSEGPGGSQEVKMTTWRHYGEHQLIDGRGTPRTKYAMAEVAGRDDLRSLQSGVPGTFEMSALDAHQKRRILAEIAPDLAHRVEGMSDTEVNNTLTKKVEDRKRGTDHSLGTEAERIRELIYDRTAQSFGAQLGISQQDIREAEANIYMHGEDELRARLVQNYRDQNPNIETSEAHILAQAKILAFKASAHRRAKETGISVRRINAFDSPDNPNPMIVEFEGKRRRRPQPFGSKVTFETRDGKIDWFSPRLKTEDDPKEEYLGNTATLGVNIAHMVGENPLTLDQQKHLVIGAGHDVSKMSDKAVREMAQELQSRDFLRRADQHYLRHEIDGHAYAERHGRRHMEKAIDDMIALATPDERAKFELLRMGNNDPVTELHTKEVLADMGISDEDLSELYEQSLERGLQFDSLGDKAVNFARMSALAERRGLRDKNGELLSDRFDSMVKQRTIDEETSTRVGFDQYQTRKKVYSKVILNKEGETP